MWSDSGHEVVNGSRRTGVIFPPLIEFLIDTGSDADPIVCRRRVKVDLISATLAVRSAYNLRDESKEKLDIVIDVFVHLIIS